MTMAWKGDRYETRRLLLLGESQYSWLDDGEIRHPGENHAAELVTEAIGMEASRFMMTLTRALSRREAPSRAERESAWAQAAFVNFVDESVGIGARIRPSAEMWSSARSRFRSLLEELRPHTVIVLGKECWTNLPDADLHLTDDVQGYRLRDGSAAICWAVQHPARGLSWRRLAQLIAFSTAREIAWEVEG